MTLLSVGKGLIILVNQRERALLAWWNGREEQEEEEEEGEAKEVADDVLGKRRIPGEAEFLSIK